ncbi:hypothetical protein EVAR_100077_1 [Eumeta japonica]|uniref:Integrase catalytic domain-containing protein n=1 Tax=Eumeta variegata TaxID=151549 RepID=A0A4C1YY63_EUMVA|nr:hypothetical protein EVAR_100077_1 [Eumeta japonica]
MLIQNIWRDRNDWDHELNAERNKEWRKWLFHLKRLDKLEIPRCVTPYHTEGELHVFTDASEKHIPRPCIELQAAVMGCRLAASVKREMNSRITNTTYWTDSKTCKELAVGSVWDNVADDATRDPPNEFSSEHRWFKGPKFLLNDPSDWPSNRINTIDQSEEIIETKAVNVIREKTPIAPVPDPYRFSSYDRLLRAAARLLQSVERFKSHKRSNTLDKAKNRQIVELTSKYLYAGEKLLFQKAQRDNFGDELRCIKRRTDAQKSKLRNMCVELDQDDVMRATGRLDRHQSLDAESKRPVILDSKNRITELLIQNAHQKCMHGNHETVINELRQKYVIFGLRNAVKGIIFKCQWCRVYRRKPTTPQQGELPAERLKAHEPPFNCSAIDYFGPMIVTVGRRTEKRWGVLITCLTTRAVHLEIAASLTPSSAILALRRFMARRGTPTVMYSDNATNFTKANKELKEAALEVEKYATAKRIVWKFIPPGAPHMGGAWERMIRTIKSSLYAVLKERKPREETLHTLLLEVEHIVNSRPTPVEPDLNREALTPNHFLIGRSCGISPIGIFKATDADSHTWKTAQRLADEFWHRWSMEYLPNLLLRKTSTAGHLEPKVGDPVLIADKTMPRGLWPRGRIVKTIPGRDNKVRIVEIQTKLGILKRPTSRLVVLT